MRLPLRASVIAVCPAFSLALLRLFMGYAH